MKRWLSQRRQLIWQSAGRKPSTQARPLLSRRCHLIRWSFCFKTLQPHCSALQLLALHPSGANQCKPTKLLETPKEFNEKPTTDFNVHKASNYCVCGPIYTISYTIYIVSYDIYTTVRRGAVCVSCGVRARRANAQSPGRPSGALGGH